MSSFARATRSSSERTIDVLRSPRQRALCLARWFCEKRRNVLGAIQIPAGTLIDDKPNAVRMDQLHTNKRPLKLGLEDPPSIWFSYATTLALHYTLGVG